MNLELHWYDIITWWDVIISLLTALTCLLLGAAGALFFVTWSDRQHDADQHRGRRAYPDQVPPPDSDWY